MSFATVLLIMSLGLFFGIMATEGTRCNTACTREYNPVCGILKRTDGRRVHCTFGNPCLLNVRRCTAQEQWAGRRGRCAKNSAMCSKLLRHH